MKIDCSFVFDLTLNGTVTLLFLSHIDCSFYVEAVVCSVPINM